MRRIVIILILVGIALGIVGRSIWRRQEVAADRAPAGAPGIRASAPRQQDLVKRYRWFGRVESAVRTRVVATEAGRIVAVAVRNGSEVAKDQLLFTIGGPVIENQLQRLDARAESLRKRIGLAKRIVENDAKAQAVTNIVLLRERVRLASENVTLMESAYKNHLVGKEELLAAKSAHAARQAELVSGRRDFQIQRRRILNDKARDEASLATLQAALDDVNRELKRLRASVQVRACSEGVFTQRRVSPGQDVSKGDVLAETVSRKQVYITATLFPNDPAATLKNAEVAIDLRGEGQAQGRVAAILPQRTAEGACVVRISIPNRNANLCPGLTVSGTISLTPRKNVLTVPRNAVVRDDEERAYVFVKGPSGYRKQPVTTGVSIGARVEIVTGVKVADAVVVEGAYELFYQNFNKIYQVED